MRSWEPLLVIMTSHTLHFWMWSLWFVCIAFCILPEFPTQWQQVPCSNHTSCNLLCLCRPSVSIQQLRNKWECENHVCLEISIEFWRITLSVNSVDFRRLSEAWESGRIPWSSCGSGVSALGQGSCHPDGGDWQVLDTDLAHIIHRIEGRRTAPSLPTNTF